MLHFLQIIEVFLVVLIRYLAVGAVLVFAPSACEKRPTQAELPEVKYPPRFGPLARDTKPAPGGCTGLDCDIIITMYADYADAYSVAQTKSIDALLQKYRGKIVFWKKDFQLDATSSSDLYAVRASICAHHQGRYWEMNQLLEEHYSITTSSAFEDLLEKKAAFLPNFEKFKQCLDDGVSLKIAQGKIDEARKKGVDRSPYLHFNMAYRDSKNRILSLADVVVGGAVFSSEEIEQHYISRAPAATTFTLSGSGVHPQGGAGVVTHSSTATKAANLRVRLNSFAGAFERVLALPFITAGTLFHNGKEVVRLIASDARDALFDGVGARELANRAYLACGYLDRDYPYTSFSIAGGHWVFAQTGGNRALLPSFQELEGERKGNFFQITSPHSLEEMRRICQQTLSSQQILREIFATNKVGLTRMSLAFRHLDENNDLAFSRMVIFGDSLSDTRNFQDYARFLPNYPYWGGNFSNGPTWSHHFGRFVPNLPIMNSAYGGSTSQAPPFGVPPNVKVIKEFGQAKLSGNMTAMVSSYVTRHREAELNERTLFFLWTGGNDYLKWLENKENYKLLEEEIDAGDDDYFEIATTAAVSSIGANLERLYDAGGRNFVLVPMPDLSITPLCQRKDSHSLGKRSVEVCAKISAMHEERLTKIYTNFLHLHPDVKGVMPPMNIYLAEILSDPHHFKLVANPLPCYDGFYGLEGFRGKPIVTCANQAAEHMFFDEVHPNYRTHCWIASLFLKDIWTQWPSLQVGSEWQDGAEFERYCVDPSRSGS